MPISSHEKGAVPLVKRSGRVNVTPHRYMDMIETFQPDFYTNLADGELRNLKPANTKSNKKCFRRHIRELLEEARCEIMRAK